MVRPKRPFSSLRPRLCTVNTLSMPSAVVERCPDTGLYVGHVPGFSGVHSQAATLEELNANLREVIELLLEEGEPDLEAGAHL